MARQTQRPTQDDLRDREHAIGERIRSAGGSDPHIIAAIDADRAMRWAPIVKSITVPSELRDWERDMIDRHGPKVRVWRNTVDWITALIIVRYGEAEYFWPHALDAEDVHRARRWQYGSRQPEGITYIVAEG